MGGANIVFLAKNVYGNKMRKTKSSFKAEKREQKNRKRMHLAGASLRKPSKYAGMSLVKKLK